MKARYRKVAIFNIHTNILFSLNGKVNQKRRWGHGSELGSIWPFQSRQTEGLTAWRISLLTGKKSPTRSLGIGTFSSQPASMILKYKHSLCFVLYLVKTITETIFEENINLSTPLDTIFLIKRMVSQTLPIIYTIFTITSKNNQCCMTSSGMSKTRFHVTRS